MEGNLCGFLCIHPRALQPCARMGTFMISMGLTCMVSQCLLTYVATQVTALERQFGLTSAQTGFLLSCNDIGFLITILIVSFFASKVHIPRVLALASLVFAVSAFLCSLPHFISIDAFHESSVISRRGQTNNESMASGGVAGIDSRSWKILDNDSDIQDNYGTYYDSTVGNNTFIAPKNESQRTNLRNSLSKLGPLQLMMMSAEVCTKQAKPTKDCNSLSARSGSSLKSDFTSLALGILICGMILQGVAKAPRMPLGVLFIDDNAKKTKLPLYLGLLIASFVIGVILSFGLGAISSSLYVTLEDVDIHPLNPRWIGAWWLGFVIIGILALLAAGSMACFPRRLVPSKLTCQDKRTPNGNTCQEMFHVLKRLVTNPVYLCVMGLISVDMLRSSGFLMFLPKYIETQFSQSAWTANILAGTFQISSGLLGSLVTGIVLSKRKTCPLTMVKIYIVLVCIIGLTTVPLAFVLGCPRPHIEGFSSTGNASGSSECGTTCHCDNAQYFPVCGADGRNYFSACHAGCKKNASLKFVNCSCIKREAEQGLQVPKVNPTFHKEALTTISASINSYDNDHSTNTTIIGSNMLGTNVKTTETPYSSQADQSVTVTSPGSNPGPRNIVPGGSWEVQLGLCSPACRMLYPYLALSAFGILFIASCSIMNTVLLMRSVQDDDRGMAYGLCSFMVTVLGWAPGPVIFGRIVDSSCLFWRKDTCSNRGSCTIYDIDSFRVRMHVYLLAISGVKLCVLIGLWYKGRGRSDWSVSANLMEEIIQARTARGGGASAVMDDTDEELDKVGASESEVMIQGKLSMK